MNLQKNYLQVFKKNALPTQNELIPNAMYLVSEGNGLVVYVTDNLGKAALSTLSSTEVLAWIGAANAAVLDQTTAYTDDALNTAKKYTDDALDKFNPNSIIVIDTYSQLHPNDKELHNKFILVRDASGDDTVKEGSATYVFDAKNKNFIKVSEHESMDLILTWDKIRGVPKVLNELSDEKGQLFYKGKPVDMQNDIILHSVEW